MFITKFNKDCQPWNAFALKFKCWTCPYFTCLLLYCGIVWVNIWIHIKYKCYIPFQWWNKLRRKGLKAVCNFSEAFISSSNSETGLISKTTDTQLFNFVDWLFAEWLPEPVRKWVLLPWALPCRQWLGTWVLAWSDSFPPHVNHSWSQKKVEFLSCDSSHVYSSCLKKKVCCLKTNLRAKNSHSWTGAAVVVIFLHQQIKALSDEHKW